MLFSLIYDSMEFAIAKKSTSGAISLLMRSHPLMEKNSQRIISQFLALFRGIFEGASGIYTLADQ
jgi:hypothetical protein